MSEADALVLVTGITPQNSWRGLSKWVTRVDEDGTIEKALRAHPTAGSLGTVVITPVGRLKARYLFHSVIVEPGGPNARGYVIRDDVAVSAARKCLATAEVLGLRSVAFTAWGAELDSTDASRTTAIQVQAIITQLQERRSCLETVYLIAEQPEHYQWFVDRASIMQVVFTQLDKVLDVVGKLEMPGTDRESLLVLLNNLRNSVVVYNEIVRGDKVGGDKVGGDKTTVGDITDSEDIHVG